jgi:hypothetical protein
MADDTSLQPQRRLATREAHDPSRSRRMLRRNGANNGLVPRVMVPRLDVVQAAVVYDNAPEPTWP